MCVVGGEETKETKGLKDAFENLSGLKRKLIIIVCCSNFSTTTKRLAPLQRKGSVYIRRSVSFRVSLLCCADLKR